MTLSYSSFPIYSFDILTSTNDKLNELLKETDLQEFSIVFTPSQTAGRGQAGNMWESEKGKNLTISILLKPIFLEPQNQFYISKIISLAIVDTLKELNIHSSIKWPNDIYVGNQKIAGILIENRIMGSSVSDSVAGIGLNVNQSKFLSDAKNPVSVYNILNEKQDIDEMLDSLINNLYKWYDVLMNGELKQIDKTYFNQLYRNTGFYKFKDSSGVFSAKISDIESTGILVLRDVDGKKRKYVFKEVEFMD